MKKYSSFIKIYIKFTGYHEFALDAHYFWGLFYEFYLCRGGKPFEHKVHSPEYLEADLNCLSDINSIDSIWHNYEGAKSDCVVQITLSNRSELRDGWRYGIYSLLIDFRTYDNFINPLMNFMKEHMKELDIDIEFKYQTGYQYEDEHLDPKDTPLSPCVCVVEDSDLNSPIINGQLYSIYNKAVQLEHSISHYKDNIFTTQLSGKEFCVHHVCPCCGCLLLDYDTKILEDVASRVSEFDWRETVFEEFNSIYNLNAPSFQQILNSANKVCDENNKYRSERYYDMGLLSRELVNCLEGPLLGRYMINKPNKPYVVFVDLCQYLDVSIFPIVSVSPKYKWISENPVQP